MSDQTPYIFQHRAFAQLPTKQPLHMGEFFNIIDAITHASRITDLGTAKKLLNAISNRIDQLSEKQAKVLKAITNSKRQYISTLLGEDIPEDVLMGMPNYYAIDHLREMISNALSNHMIRNEIQRGNTLKALDKIAQMKEIKTKVTA